MSVVKSSRSIVLIATLLFAARGIGQKSPRETLYQSAQLLDKGLYEQALTMLNSVNIRSDLDNSEEMKMAFKIKAIAHAQLNDEKRAREIVRELLFLDPHYSFDPFDTPPKIVKLAQEEQANIAEKNQRLAQVRDDSLPGKETIPSSATPTIAKISTTHDKAQTLINLLPFGLNHFALKSPVKGGLYLSLQALGIAGNIGAYWWKQSYLQQFGLPYLSKVEYKSRFEMAQTIQHVALATAVLAFCVSVIDAFISMKHQSLDEG